MDNNTLYNFLDEVEIVLKAATAKTQITNGLIAVYQNKLKGGCDTMEEYHELMNTIKSLKEDNKNTRHALKNELSALTNKYNLNKKDIAKLIKMYTER
jgi:gas vesicle protein